MEQFNVVTSRSTCYCTPSIADGASACAMLRRDKQYRGYTST